MPIVGEKPRPRALLMGLAAEEVELLAQVFPTYKTVKSTEDVRQAEWDVLITRANVVSAAPHIYVLSLGGVRLGAIKPRTLQASPPGIRGGECSYGSASLASEFIVHDGLPLEILRLVESDLLRRLREETSHRTLVVDAIHEEHGRVHIDMTAFAFEPFISTADNAPIAGRAKRGIGPAEVWCLPFNNVDLLAWVKAAVRQWHKEEPSRFPTTPGWEHGPEWMTSSEAEIAGKINIIQKQRQETLARLSSMEQELRAPNKSKV